METETVRDIAKRRQRLTTVEQDVVTLRGEVAAIRAELVQVSRAVDQLASALRDLQRRLPKPYWVPPGPGDGRL